MMRKRSKSEARWFLLVMPPIEVVCNHFRQTQELQMLALGTLHDAYAPVDVSRESVAQVVRLGTGYVCAGVERLVAH